MGHDRVIARLRRLVWWGVATVVGYLLLAPLVLVGALWVMLTAGVTDWALANDPNPPLDPVVVGYRGDPHAAFGWDYETVRYESDLGPTEAWLVPPAVGTTRSGIWAIWVHGIGGTRENGYRMVKVLHEAGLPVLLIAYRNDPGAPRTDDGTYSFGLSEWRDLEAAVDWAIAHGAEDVVIAAESMGGGITGQFLARSDRRERVVALALDAPALDFNAVIAAGGARYRIPLDGYVAAAGLAVWSTFRPNLKDATSLEAVADFDGPVFLAHGRGDPLVPFSISEALVARRPGIVFWPTVADRHPRSFEHDPEGYIAAMHRWLAMLPGV